MKKIFLIVAAFLFSLLINGQDSPFNGVLGKSMITKLLSNDSMVFYQCHVEELAQQITTASGQTLSPAAEKYSITEKFVIYRHDSTYTVKHFVSSMIVLPNRRFSGLKIREKSHWNFKKLKEESLSEKDLQLLAAIELKGKEPTEYDFAISKYNTNQVIIKQRKNFRQMNIDGNYILSKLIFE